MTKDELITKQQLEIENLNEEIKNHSLACDDIYGILFNIGAPLNDNVLQYSAKQRKPFHEIAEILGF